MASLEMRLLSRFSAPQREKNATASTSKGISETVFGPEKNATASTSKGTSETVSGRGKNATASTSKGTSETVSGREKSATASTSKGTSETVSGRGKNATASTSKGTSETVSVREKNATASTSKGTSETVSGRGKNATASTSKGTSETVSVREKNATASTSKGTSETVSGREEIAIASTSKGTSETVSGREEIAIASTSKGTSETVSGREEIATASTSQGTSETVFGREIITDPGSPGKSSASIAPAHSPASPSTSRKHRSRSTTRCEEKPNKKKQLGRGSTSMVSIPNAIKLSMLNSGLMPHAAENGVGSTIPMTPTELKYFPKLCEQRRKFPVLYKVEFQSAAKVETHSCRHAMKVSNKEKNQNPKCIPYDYNRVVLTTVDDIPDSDYINASYVDSLLKPNAYIVTQGPTENTVQQFWRMVWQEKASCIVMLTKTFDFIKVMCVQYWPASIDKSEVYGDLQVQILHEEELANFHIRTIRLTKLNEQREPSEERTLLQFHYTEWHSHSCPFSNALLEFRRRIRAVIESRMNWEGGPMIVHCNDGGGRSGVYLSIDANLELAEEEDCFNVFGYLKKLRQSRKGLIESIEQYKFVYDTLEEFVVCGATWFPVKDLSNRLKQKSAKDPSTKMNEYKKEFQQICKLTPKFSIGDCAGGHRGDNHEKNRDVLMVPPDNFRPYLTSFQGNNFTDYINAVFVDGYTKPREYIVTEWPLKHTCGEFWSLVYDYECSAVVVLCVPPDNSHFPAFWPEGRHSRKYGPVFTIDHISHNHYTNIKSWIFRINKKIVSLTELMAGVKAPAKTVQLFQLMCWPMGHKVPTSTNSLVELMNMVERWRQRTDYGPVAVVSPDGRSRCGVYCAANACIEQVIQHGEVDVFQAVKTVRRHRPQLIENLTEYKYCYDVVLHYVLHYLDKDMKEKK